ncbi:hypothetical protein [Dolichospermum phage Dfl-JY45]
MSVIPPLTKTTAARSVELQINAALEHLGRYVREFREQGRGLTQQELAEAAGVHRDTVARLEAGNSVNLEVLLKIWQALGVLPNALKLMADQEVLVIETARTLSRQAVQERTGAPPSS